MLPPITSKENEKIKNAAKLSSLAKERKKQGMFVAETVKMIEQAVISGADIQYVLTTEQEYLRNPLFFDRFADNEIPLYFIAPELCRKISELSTPPGSFAICKKLDKPADFAMIKGERPTEGVIVALENLQDPGNIGTILRTAMALGASGAILSENAADLYSPKVLRAAMGAVFSFPVIQPADFFGTLEKCRDSGYTLYGTALDDTALRMGSFCFDKKSVLLIGNEGSGLTERALSVCDKKVLITMSALYGPMQSLNASAAAAIALWEATRPNREG